MNALSDNQIQRQDFVDNSIFELLHKLNPSKQEIKWDIDAIGEIRDLIQFWFVKRLAITDEMIFYPYIDTDEQS